MQIFILIIACILILLNYSNAFDINHIKKSIKKIMATLEQFEEILNSIDETTNDIAAEIESLKEIIAGGGLSAEAEANILSRLQAASDKLKGVGKEPLPEEEELPE